MAKLYNVGIYCRLSVDDGSNSAKKNYIEGDESSSIENQRQMLSKFTVLQGWIETKVYCDDGYGGGNFNRPGFREMIADAQAGIINLILCKDLSRLGRDYIEVGRYTDILFPSWGVRFIALLDEIDTAKDDNDMMHFRSLMNDYHQKDLSNKVKTVFRAKTVKHGLITGRAPYGYIKSPKNKHQLLPDPEAAPVIRRLFALRAEGASYNTIARTLNTEGHLTANDYWAIKKGKTVETPTLWTVRVVKNYLNTEYYIGNIVNNRKPVISHKDDKRRKTDEAEWIRHENTHEPLIDQGTWDTVQEMERELAEKAKTFSPKKQALFGSKLFCADCGSTLLVQTMGHPNKQTGKWERDGTSYACHRHIMTGRSVCSRHTIGENPLKKIVLAELGIYAQAIILDEEALLNKLRKQMAVDNSESQLLLQKEVRRLQADLDESDRITAQLYEDKVGGKISSETFSKLLAKNEQERKKRRAQFDEANSRLTAINDKLLSITKWAGLVRKHSALKDFTRADVEELIDHIEVGESSYCTKSERVQEIHIFWRFIGYMGG
jgi:DNA invertase Pin-like site-specific DNA recombinase